MTNACNKNIVIYDWVSLTSRIHDVDAMKELVGLTDVAWQETKGARGYKRRLYFSSISIHYDGEENMGVWLEMSGQGCRTFETYSSVTYEELFNELRQYPEQMNLTRLDIAFDDHTGILEMPEIIRATREEEYVSKSQAWYIEESWKGSCVWIGSPQSEVRIRLYDKAAERGLTDGSHWTRVELQMRNERARCFTKYDYLTVGQTFVGVLVNYLRYVIPDENDTNKARWEMQPYWKDLIEDAMALSIYEKPGMEYNLSQLHDHLVRRNGNGIDTYIQIVGLGQFLEELHHEKPENVNPKYSRLLAEYKNKKKKEIPKNENQDHT